MSNGIEIKVDLADFGIQETSQFYLPSFIEDLTTALDSIPKEYQETAIFSIDTDWDDRPTEFSLVYTRPKTKEEIEYELAEPERRKLAQKFMIEQRERQEYERLKKKFG
jgi:hypothetical protein